MKNISISISFFFLSIFSVQATIHQVNNSNPSPAQFTSLQAAIDAAQDGDTIYLHGSPTSYGNVTVNKRLVIFGSGFAPQSQLMYPATIGNLTLNTSTNPVTGVTTSATGSEFNSFRVAQIAFNPDVHEVYFERLHLTNLQSSTNLQNIQGRNHTFIGCSFRGRFVAATNQNNYNLQFINCIFAASVEFFFNSHYHNVTVSNCIFTRHNSGDIVNLVASSSNQSRITFTNNIFMFYNPVPNCANCVFINNMSFGAGVVDLNDHGVYSENNFIAQSLGFENFSFFMPYNPGSHDLNLTANSPAKGAGINGVDLGVMGGEDIYFDKGGEPRLPKFELLQLLTPAVPQGEDVKVRLRATVVTD